MTSDVITQSSLLAGGLAAAFVFAVHYRLYFGLSAAALLFLGADEGLDIHERAGMWIEDRTGTWLLQDADALVLAAWGAAFLGLTVWRWNDLAGVPIAAWAWIGGAACAAVALVMDAFVPHGIRGAHSEEFFEAVAAISLSGAYAAHAVAALRRPAFGAEAAGGPMSDA